jgi:hypothetical protein
MFRVSNKESPLTVLADVKMLNLEYDQDHEANGHACFNELAEVTESLGVNLFKVLEKERDGSVAKYENSTLIHHHEEQWRTSEFDNGGGYDGNGPGKSARARLICDHGIGDKTHFVFYDMAHSYDLLIDYVYTELSFITKTIHKAIQQVYVHICQSPHQQRRLEALAKACGAMICLERFPTSFTFALSLPSSKPPITFF